MTEEVTVNLEKLMELERKMDEQIGEVEMELRAIWEPTQEPKDEALAPHWEQVLSLMRDGHVSESVYALVRVVQRLLDEKANQKTMNEKVGRQYVDSLYERVATGVKDNMRLQVTKSVEELQEEMNELKEKVMNLEAFMRSQMQAIRGDVEALQRMDEEYEKEKRQLDPSRVDWN